MFSINSFHNKIWHALWPSGKNTRLPLATAANTPTATTPEDVSHRWGQNVEGKKS